MEPQQNKSSQKNVTHQNKERPNISVNKDDESECCCSLFQINNSRPGNSYLFYEEMDDMENLVVMQKCANYMAEI